MLHKRSRTVAIGAFILISLMIINIQFNVPRISAATQTQSTSPNLPSGYPGDQKISSLGSSLIPLIEATSQFRALTNGITYHTDPSTSFGYSWGPNIPSMETIIFYSPNRTGQIEVDVYVTNSTIQHMYYNNVTSLPSSTNGSPNDNWSGYQMQYCNWNGLWCGSYSNIVEVYGNVQIPNSESTPGTGEDASCCWLSMWTGVGNSSSGAWLMQGGADWAGVHQTPPSQANSNGYFLWTEYFNPSDQGKSPLSPPSWMSGVSGQTIVMTTEVTGSCIDGSHSGDQWSQVWTIGSNQKTQYINCVEVGSINWGYSELESASTTGSSSICSAGYYDNPHYFCQIPDFAYSGGSLSWTANICSPSTCQNADANHNYLNALYVYQTTQDTSVGTIAQNGNSFTEGWVSSVQ